MRRSHEGVVAGGGDRRTQELRPMGNINEQQRLISTSDRKLERPAGVPAAGVGGTGGGGDGSSLTLNDAEMDGVSIWVGGKVSNARTEPKFSKLAIPYIPNNPPRWPEVVEAVKNIVDVYAKGARKFERMGEWIERIGWQKFFELTGIETFANPATRANVAREFLFVCHLF